MVVYTFILSLTYHIVIQLKGMIGLPTFDSVLVTGNQTIQQDLQVNGNMTVQGSFQVNGNQTIANSLALGSNVDAAGSVLAAFRVVSGNQPTQPAGARSLQEVRFYGGGNGASQPGLVLKGTDGLDYVLFIDVSSGSPAIGIQLA
jgi:hypothetical protein